MRARRARIKLNHFSPPEERITRKTFLVKVYKNSESHNRFRVIVSRKVDARATSRNRIKRRMLGAMKRWPNFRRDFLIVAHPAIHELSRSELQRELRYLETQLKSRYL